MKRNVIYAIIVVVLILLLVWIGIAIRNRNVADSPTDIDKIESPILGSNTGQIDSDAASTSRQTTAGRGQTGTIAGLTTQSALANLDIKTSPSYGLLKKDNRVFIYNAKGAYVGSVEMLQAPGSSASLEFQEAALEHSKDVSNIKRVNIAGREALGYYNSRTKRNNAIVVSGNTVYFMDGAGVGIADGVEMAFR